MASGPMFPRILRAARIDSQLYEEVEADSGGTGQALTVVVLVSLATGIGNGLNGAIRGGGESLLPLIFGLVSGIIGALLGWFALSLVTFLLGTTIFKGPDTRASLGELLRTLGFADSPGILNIFTFVPVVGSIIPFVTWVWTIIASVVAVRQACDFSTGRAIGTLLIGAIIYLFIIILVGLFTAGALATMLGLTI